ncbi:MAG: hypothetical protein OXM02_12195 [Bacteroidota bacterium]|nr:hypothetical protein [Bacteroidota bacterium]MDE2835262.1 hypothetical protein [Bacteroidota bacterium]MDE2957516.1 hypothetical protein [Bacteroidota bacterium]
MVQDGAAKQVVEPNAFRQTLYRVLLIQLLTLGVLAALQLLYH